MKSMNYWLLKTEPDVFSWDDLVARGIAEWDGVRNFMARNNMRAMKKGDHVFIYHSNIGKTIVGIAVVVSEAHQDSTDTTGVWQCVDVAPVKKLHLPVSLATIKNDPRFAEMQLVTHGRLSVQMVSKENWEKILELSD